MNLTIKIAIAGVLLATAPALAANNMTDGKPEAKVTGGEPHHGQNYGRHGKMGRHGMMGRHAKMRGRGLMAIFDSDKDGRLTQAEIDKSRADRLAKFDKDGNGSPNLSEYQALWLAAMRERMVDRFQDLDADGDAVVTAQEFKRPFANLVRRMDRDGDGVLTRQHGMKRPHNK